MTNYNHSEQKISATWSTLNPEVDMLQQEKSISSTHYCEEQEAEAAMGTGSPKLDILRLKKSK